MGTISDLLARGDAAAFVSVGSGPTGALVALSARTSSRRWRGRRTIPRSGWWSDRGVEPGKAPGSSDGAVGGGDDLDVHPGRRCFPEKNGRSAFTRSIGISVPSSTR